MGTQDTKCGTKDTHINFGEYLDDIDWKDAERACTGAGLCIVAGTSMSLRHITHFPFMAKQVCIINLQPTPDDERCDLRIWGKCDAVFTGLMQRLGIEVDPTPVWRPRDAVPLHALPKDLNPYYVAAAKRLEQTALRRKAEAQKREAEARKREAEDLKAAQVAATPVKEVCHVEIGNRHRHQTTQNNPHHWTMHVSGKDASGQSVSGAIESVTFQLHPTFSPSQVVVRASTPDQTSFEFSGNGWGTFNVGVTIKWRDTHMSPMNLSHMLSFDVPSNSRLVPVS